MDWLTFISSLIESLAWPVAFIVAILLFRKPLTAMIPFLQKLRYKDFEVEFNQDLKEIKEEIQKTLPSPELPSETEEFAIDRLNQLAAISPQAAIIEAWREVEIAAKELGQRHDIIEKVPLRLGDKLNIEQIIDKNQVGLFHRLRQLRNNAAHAQGKVLSYDEAIEFGRLAIRLAETFRTM